MNYAEFLETKRIVAKPSGFDIDDSEINQSLYPFQRYCVRWALRRGRAALFEDCGLGKTFQQIEFVRIVREREGRSALIVCPLAVAPQTVREGAKIGVQITKVRHAEEMTSDGIYITNYEMLDKFSPEAFSCIVLDESSILKAFDGTYRKMITAFASGIKYRLACTATPAPNDLIELSNHAEFLNIMDRKEIVALFFRQDGNDSHNMRLKNHAVQDFWKWLASWCIAIRSPADIGFDGSLFVLPGMDIQQHIVHDENNAGFLFAMEACTLQERRSARRGTVDKRVAKAAEIANATDEQVLVWCDLNLESDALKRAINGAVEVKGSDSVEHKENSLSGFALGNIRVLVTKPTIAGFGMNFQNCRNVVFVGLSDSYEQYYQAICRCHRFGQKNRVNVNIVFANTEGNVIANIERKERQAREMFQELCNHMKDVRFESSERIEHEYVTETSKGDGWKMILGDSIEKIKEIESESVGLTVFSPPFPGMYAYTNSPRDVGNCKNFSELIEHFSMMMSDILRITKPGRECCIHLTQEPVFKGREGYVGLRDFRGDVIRAMENAGWYYYSEVTIDKNPMLKASRTKEATLLFKTLSSDSAGCRPALADYLLVFRKPGENKEPIPAGTHARWNPKEGWISSEEWCEWAAPVWYRRMPKDPNPHQPWQGNYPSRHQSTDGILETHVLKTGEAKENDDEKHLCPLQLGVIERCVKLWSNPGDVVFSPFAGIGSEGYTALKFNRRFLGIELKPSYYRVACQNMARAIQDREQTDLFSYVKKEEAV